MKTIRLLSIALAAAAIFSCSKDGDSGDSSTVEAGLPATLTLSIEGSTISTKASGTAVDADDAVINDYMIFVFRSDGSLDAAPEQVTATGSSSETYSGDITTSASVVYVVANVPSDLTTSLSAVTSESSLKSTVADLKASDLQAEDVVMNGYSALTFVDTDATATATMSFPLSKINLIVKDGRTNASGTGLFTVVDNSVVVLFAGEQIKLFSDDTDSHTTFYTGDQSYSDYTTSTLWSDGLSTTAGTFGDTDNTTVSHHFYVPANSGTSMPTILAIQSTLTETSTSTTTTIYYPVHFSSTDAGTTLEAGSSYTVTMTLGGDVATGGAQGTTDPEDEIISGDVAVTIVPATWTPASISKEFN